MPKFGVELETISTLSQREFADVFNAAGIRATEAGYSSQGYRNWQMKNDGSIMVPYGRRSNRIQEDTDETRLNRTYRYGVEIVSRVLDYPADKAELEQAVELASNYATVNTSTGFHVHVSAEGMTNDKVVRLKRLWNRVEPIVFSYLPPSRRSNHYCRRGASDDGNRYHALNLTCMATKGTVEFRCHHGTLNKKKVLSWVSFCIALVEYAKGNDPIPTFDIRANAQGGADLIDVNYRGRVFTITPSNNQFLFQNVEYATLKDAVLAVVKTLNPERQNKIADRFITRNVKRVAIENNGMSVACRTLGIEQDAQTFLVERYDLAVRTWGLSN